MRRARARRAALAALALLVTGAAACTDDGGDGGDGTTTTLRPTTTTEPSELTGLPLELVEQGVSSFPDPYDRSQSLGGYGVVLRNPNPDLMAVGIHVNTKVLDAAGNQLTEDNALLNAIMPNQRMAVGRTIIEPIAGPTQLVVSAEVSAWLYPASATGAFAAESAVTEPEPFGGAVTRFAVRSTWPTNEDGVDVTALYRAADGRILSAEMTSVASLPAGGVVLGEIRLLSPIPGLTSTEVFVGRGFNAQTAG